MDRREEAVERLLVGSLDLWPAVVPDRFDVAGVEPLVEHGNLGITYKEKTKLIQDGAWEAELTQRLVLPQYAGRRASVMLTRDNNEIRFVVADQGDGFDWKPFMEFSPDRAFDPHGRGISMARMLSFDNIEYQGNGNTVLATVKLG